MNNSPDRTPLRM